MELQRFSKAQIVTVVTFAIVAGCMPALQPLLLGGLLEEGRLDASSLGYAATAEGLGMVLGTGVAGAFLPARRLRLLGVLAIGAVIAANLATMVASSGAIVAARAASGLGNGILTWISVGLLIRAANPTRLYAAFITGNASLVFLLSTVLATYSIALFGIVSGYVILCAIYIVMLFAIPLVPREYADLEEGGASVGMPPAWGLVALAGPVLFLAGIMAFWVYSVQLGEQAGLGTDTMRRIVSAAIGVQILAGLAAMVLADRLSGKSAFIVTGTIAALALIATQATASTPIWFVALLVFSFCWMFGPPFHIAFISAADPTRKAAIYISTAQLSGIALGPLLASSAVSSIDYGPARAIALGCLIGALIVGVVIHLRFPSPRASRPQADGAA